MILSAPDVIIFLPGFLTQVQPPYNVILTDIKMPNMDGVTAAKEIRRPWLNNCPKIIALTAYALAEDKGRCLEAGMDDYIAKSMKMADLAEKLISFYPFNTVSHDMAAIFIFIYRKNVCRHQITLAKKEQPINDR